ncbi:MULTISPECIES: peptidoglycan-binding protein [unclassified Agrobacterium]
MATAAQIKRLCPSAKPALVDAIVKNWDYAELEGDIVTPLRVQHFLSQIATETGGLKAVEESLNYSVDGLLNTFGRHRISEADAKRLGRFGNRKAKQEEIANIVYGGAWGKKNLGNIQAGDGWKYRGGGMMQTTGRENYQKMGFADNPEGLRDPVTAFKSAVREWRNRGCNALADKDDVVAVRKKINGGSNGLSESRDYLAQAKKIFKTVSAVATPVNVPVPEPKPVQQDDKLVERVQDLLWDKGYPEVGESDNKYGRRTRNAILAFQADNNLPLTGEITDELIAQLVKAPKREMAPARQNATEKDLKTEPVVKEASWLKKIGMTIFGGALFGGITDGTASLDDITNGVTQVRTIFETVQPVLPWLLMAAAGAGVFYFGRRAVHKYVEAYREGRAL